MSGESTTAAAAFPARALATAVADLAVERTRTERLGTIARLVFPSGVAEARRLSNDTSPAERTHARRSRPS
jgi:hypothetical protein